MQQLDLSHGSCHEEQIDWAIPAAGIARSVVMHFSNCCFSGGGIFITDICHSCQLGFNSHQVCLQPLAVKAYPMMWRPIRSYRSCTSSIGSNPLKNSLKVHLGLDSCILWASYGCNVPSNPQRLINVLSRLQSFSEVAVKWQRGI